MASTISPPGRRQRTMRGSRNTRAKLDWDASDTITMEFGAYYMFDKSRCCAYTWESPDPDTSLLGLPIGYPADGIKAGDDNFKFRGEDGPYSKSETTGGYVRIERRAG